jgi:hypothetical protein
MQQTYVEDMRSVTALSDSHSSQNSAYAFSQASTSTSSQFAANSACSTGTNNTPQYQAVMRGVAE